MTKKYSLFSAISDQTNDGAMDVAVLPPMGPYLRVGEKRAAEEALRQPTLMIGA